MGINSKKLLITVFLAAAMLAGGALAAQQPAPYPAAFWVNGVITSPVGGPTDLSGFVVIYYSTAGDNAAAYGRAVTDAGGQFRINIMEDLRMLSLVGGKTYYIGIVNKDGYGLNETTTVLESPDLVNGFKNLTEALVLAAGQGVPDPAMAITIKSPAGGENWPLGSTQLISWEAAASITNVSLAYSTDGGVNYQSINTVANTGTYVWTLPIVSSANARVRVSDAANPAISAESNVFTLGSYTMRGGPQMRITLLLDGYYNATADTQRGASFEVELRKVSDGTVVTSVPFYLMLNNNTVALDGVGETIAPDSYKIVMKHLNHLAIILTDAVALSTTATAEINLSDPAVTLEYTAPGGTTTPMITRSSRKVMRGGEYKSDGLVTVDDWSDWKDAYGSDPSKPNWNPRADGNGDGLVTVDDWDIWKDNYGSRSYVPTP
jgi:hypothetical protein